MNLLTYCFKNRNISKAKISAFNKVSIIILASVFLLLFLNKAAAFTNFESLDYLYQIQGTKTLGGMHNRQPNAVPNTYSIQLNEITGLWPAVYSSDFQFETDEIANRQTMIDQVKLEHANGAMINLMWHACNPAKEQPCGWDNAGVLSSMTDSEWLDLLSDGTAINNKWKQMMDEVAVYLQQLEDDGIEVMWRPLHEMNHANFWWNGRPGVDGTPALFRMTHDYFTNKKGLTNLIWVWNLQDYATLSTDLEDYDPGSQYWDVLTLDMYSTDGKGYTTEKYNAMVNKANGKPIAIGECFVIPTIAELASQPLWTFFMPWSEYTFRRNSDSNLQAVYGGEKVLDLSEMPGWSGSGGNPDNPVLFTDPLNDFSLLDSYSNKLSLDNSNSSYFDGDTSRIKRTQDSHEHITYKLPGAISDFIITTHFWRTNVVQEFEIQLSSDGVNYTTYHSAVTTGGIGAGNWEIVTYTGSNISSGNNYIKIIYPLNDSGIKPWHPQIGHVDLNYLN